MTRAEIIGQAKEVLSEEFEVGQELMADDAALREVLALNSLTLVDLVAVVEHTFRVRIPIAEVPSIKTFAQLYDYIEQHI